MLTREFSRLDSGCAQRSQGQRTATQEEETSRHRRSRGGLGRREWHGRGGRGHERDQHGYGTRELKCTCIRTDGWMNGHCGVQERGFYFGGRGGHKQSYHSSRFYRDFLFFSPSRVCHPPAYLSQTHAHHAHGVLGRCRYCYLHLPPLSIHQLSIVVKLQKQENGVCLFLQLFITSSLVAPSPDERGTVTTSPVRLPAGPQKRGRCF